MLMLMKFVIVLFSIVDRAVSPMISHWDHILFDATHVKHCIRMHCFFAYNGHTFTVELLDILCKKIHKVKKINWIPCFPPHGKPLEWKENYRQMQLFGDSCSVVCSVLHKSTSKNRYCICWTHCASALFYAVLHHFRLIVFHNMHSVCYEIHQSCMFCHVHAPISQCRIQFYSIR